MLHYLFIGTVLGLSAGFAPGPLLTLVITETLQHDIRSGVKVALAPIITDLPIIVLTLFVLAKLATFHSVLGMISLAGGLFVFYMGYGSLRTKKIELDIQEIKPRPLTKGILANALSPHPYLFWATVGAPTMAKAHNLHISAAAAFITSFYFFLIGSKVLLAVITGRSKSFLTGTIYIFIMRFLGLLLWLLAVLLILEGLELMGIV